MSFGIFLHGRFVFSYLIYLFNLLFISIWSYDFFQYLDYNPIVLILFLKLFPALAIESHVPLKYFCHCFCWLVCLFVLSSFHFLLVLWCSRLILYIYYSSPQISQFSKEPWFLLLKKSVRNRYVGTRYSLIFKLPQHPFLLSDKDFRYQIFGKNAAVSVFPQKDNNIESNKSLNTHTHIFNLLHFNRKQQK